MGSKQIKERIFFRIHKGALVPADGYASMRLRARNYKLNDIVAVSIHKLRSPGMHRFAHVIGQILAQNIDAFHGMDAHKILKRLQIEGNIACDEIAADIGDGMKIYRLPQSLSFDSMDEGEFREVMGKICHFICEKYWPEETPEAIEQMALSYLEAA